MTVFNETEFVEQAIWSVLPYVDDLVIVEGAYQESIAIGAEPRSTDGTIDKIKKIIDFEDESGNGWDKIHYIEANEKSDKDQRNVGLEKIKELNPDGWLLIVDGDEVYTKHTLKIVKKSAKILNSKNKFAAYFASLTFVNDLDHCTLQEFPRLFKITPKCKFVDDNRMEWENRKIHWDHDSVVVLKYIMYHHYAFVKSVDRFLHKKKWWETRFGEPFDYGWHIDDNGKITDPNHRIEKYEGKHPEAMQDHPLLKEEK